MEKSIWRKKPMAAYEADMKKSELKRVLTKWGLTSLGIGAIIGGGIFTLTGIAAHNFAGPALAIAFIIAAIGCTFASLCYSEFASILPVEGSAYAYSYGTVGEFFAWIIGWNLILEYMMGATTVAVAWSGYFEKFLHLFGIELPVTLMNDPFTAGEKLGLGGPTPAFNIAAFFITWIVTSILVRGIQESAKTNNIIVIVKLSVVIFVILVGAFYVKVENWTPFIPDTVTAADGTTTFGWDGVITAATIVFFAYIGFDAVSTQAGEAINPRKDVPFAIIASLIICTVLYILVSLVLTGMVKYDTLDLKAPVASAFADAGTSLGGIYYYACGGGWSYFGNACDDVGTNSYFLRNGERWFITKFLQRNSPNIQNSLEKHIISWVHRFDYFGGYTNRQGFRNVFGRNITWHLL